MTGSKNAMKGLGFFVGGALLAAAGFQRTNLGLAALLAAFAALAVAVLPRTQGRAGATLAGVLRQDRRMWWLSIARMFLFGSRDAEGLAEAIELARFAASERPVPVRVRDGA